MSFLTEPLPAYGQPTSVAPAIRRIVAENPSVMTYHGTNTYILDDARGATVIDPGPDLAAHVEAIVAATGGRVARIVVTHRHADHVGAAPALKAATGAPISAFGSDDPAAFQPDHELRHGDVVDGLTVLHTPGHASDHVCLARGDGVLLSGDHVMSWSSSVVSPPGGDMGAYFSSLALLLERDDQQFLPGHGPPLPEPRRFVLDLLEHRRSREKEILEALRDGPLDSGNLVASLYSKHHPRLIRAAERNVIAHLMKLRDEGRVDMLDDQRWTRRDG